MKKAVLSSLVFTVVLIAASPGISPRVDANSYQAHQELADFALGAVLIPPDQVKKMFKFDLNRAGYVVVEVGVYPGHGKDVDLNPADFTLSTGDKFEPARPVNSDTIAEVLAGKEGPKYPRNSSDVNTSAGVYVGRESYPDPVTGRQTTRTVTGTEAGVGVGRPAPYPCRGYDCDTTTPLPPPNARSSSEAINTITQDLWQKSLPDGKTPRAVAGYLYFPKPNKKAKDAVWELRYENADGKTRLPLSK